MRRDRWIAFVVALGVGIAACEAQEADVEDEAPADTVDHEAAVDQVRSGYEQAWNAGDVEGVIALYDTDFREITMDADMDYAAVASSLRDSSAIPPGATLAITADEFRVAEAGDLAYGMGTTTFTATGPDGQPMTGHDRWLAVFSNVDGAWKLHRLAILPEVGAGGDAMDSMPADAMDAAPADTAATM